MSIATEITRIQQAKADIKTAIEAKGVTVPSSATIDTYDDYVSQISGGSGTSYETELKGLIDRTISGSLTIPNGVASIGNNVFEDCTGLTSVAIPNGITSIGDGAFKGCTGLTSVAIPNGITSIGSEAFRSCRSLTSCRVQNSVTSIGSYAFSAAGYLNTPFDVSSIDLSNVHASTDFSHIFADAHIHGNITIPNSLLSGSTSGSSSTCYYLFSGAFCERNLSLTINIYADGVIIPRNMCQFSNASTINTGNINIIVHGTPTFLSRQSFRVISGTEVAAQSVTFADCTTPPNAEGYTNTLYSPFYQLKGTIYVPSSGLDAWKAKYTGIADKIQAIPS